MSVKQSMIYIFRQVLNSESIHKWMESHNIFLPENYDPLHITSIYSEHSNNSVIKTDPTSHYIEPSKKRKFAHFGTCGVLLVDSTHLHRRFRYFKSMGIRHAQPEYNPHLTLQSGPIHQDIEPYCGPIVLGPEIMERVAA